MPVPVHVRLGIGIAGARVRSGFGAIESFLHGRSRLDRHPVLHDGLPELLERRRLAGFAPSRRRDHRLPSPQCEHVADERGHAVVGAQHFARVRVNEAVSSVCEHEQRVAGGPAQDQQLLGRIGAGREGFGLVQDAGLDSAPGRLHATGPEQRAIGALEPQAWVRRKA